MSPLGLPPHHNTLRNYITLPRCPRNLRFAVACSTCSSYSPTHMYIVHAYQHVLADTCTHTYTHLHTHLHTYTHTHTCTHLHTHILYIYTCRHGYIFYTHATKADLDND